MRRRRQRRPGSAEAVARRIQPVGSIQVKDASDAGALKTGEQVFTAQCSACPRHRAPGVPKFGDSAAWGRASAPATRRC